MGAGQAGRVLVHRRLVQVGQSGQSGIDPGVPGGRRLGQRLDHLVPGPRRIIIASGERAVIGGQVIAIGVIAIDDHRAVIINRSRIIPQFVSVRVV